MPQKMTLSLRGAIESVCNEAIVLRPYLDSKRIWTIGIGHTASAGPPDPAKFKGEMSVKDAFELFMDVDAPKYAERVNRAVKVVLAQHEFDALFDFDYNTGAILRATLTKTLNAGDRAGAAAQFLNYSKPPEIIARRRRSMELFRTGKYHQQYAMLLPVTARNTPDFARGRRLDLLAMFDGKTMVMMPPTKLAPALVVGTPGYLGVKATGDEVVAWQNTLIELGYTLRGGADGAFGPSTVAATEAFQRDAGLTVDGRVGPATRGAALGRLGERDGRVAPVAEPPTPAVEPFELVVEPVAAEPVVVPVTPTVSVVVTPPAPEPEPAAPTPPTEATTPPEGSTVTVDVAPAKPAYEIVAPAAGVPVVDAPDITPRAANPNSGETSIGARSLKQLGVGGVVVVALTALLNWIGG